MGTPTVFAKNDGHAGPLAGPGVVNEYTQMVEVLFIKIELQGDYLIFAKAEIWNQDSNPQSALVGIYSLSGVSGPISVNWISQAHVGLDGNNGGGPLTQQSVFLIGKHSVTTSGSSDDDTTNFVYLGVTTLNGQCLRYSLWATPVSSIEGFVANISAVGPIGYGGP